MRNVFILSFLHLTAVSSSTLITVLTKCRFLQFIYLVLGGQSDHVVLREIFSWKNSSKLNKVINEETAFKFVTAWEESYDVITRQLSIRQYTFMKKGSLFKWKTARSWIYFISSSCESAFTENIHWRITQKVNDFHVCFQFTKVNLHNYLGENYSMETNLWANYYFSEFQCLALNNWYSEMGVKWGKDMLSYGG